MIAAITLITALLIACYLGWHIYLAHISKKWPATSGHLLAIKIDERTTYSKFPSVQGNEKIAILSVKYEYWVNERKYVGNRIHFGMMPKYAEPVEIISSPIYINLKNNDFSVFYWPALPFLSTLTVGQVNIKSHVYTIIFMFVMALAVCLFATIVGAVIQ